MIEQAGPEPLPGEEQAGCFMEAACRPGPEAQGGQMEGPWQGPRPAHSSLQSVFPGPPAGGYWAEHTISDHELCSFSCFPGLKKRTVFINRFEGPLYVT